LEPFPDPPPEPVDVVVVLVGVPLVTEPPQPAANPTAINKIAKKKARTKSPDDPSLDLLH
jgi:hypothetical protein